MEFLWLAIGLVTGVLLGYFIGTLKVARVKTRILENEKETGRELASAAVHIQQLEAFKTKLEEELLALREAASESSKNLARREVEVKNLEEKLETQKSDIEALQKRFKDEFENLANKIFEEKSQKFSLQNKTNIDMILSPLKEKIQSFERKVEDTYQKSLKDQTDLRAELRSLHEMNVKISEDATNLTRALKGDVKKQGNWGEIVLERILERSGLTKGVEYITQESTRNEAGELIRPDVIVHLPEGKHIVIDSKVSLVAYEQYVNSEDKSEVFLKQHVDSIKTHIKQLSEKSYQLASTIISPDFVLLFMPIESAFSIAVQSDHQLFNFAWERKIVIVSPSTLLATLKTVESIWRQEKQTQNAIEIARQGGNLYDKFVAFVSDLEKLGAQIQTSSRTYEEVMKKFSTGKGNLVSRAINLKKLGVKASKSLPEKYSIEEETTETEANEDE